MARPRLATAAAVLGVLLLAAQCSCKSKSKSSAGGEAVSNKKTFHFHYKATPMHSTVINPSMMVAGDTGLIRMQLEKYPKAVRVPDYMVPGCQKCATSSLYNYLTAHPNITVSKKKETFALAKSYGESNACGQHFDVDRYVARWYPQAAQLEATSLMGEFTTSYLHCLCCHKIMAEINPAMKLIVLLRDPYERAKSRFLEQGRFRNHFWKDNLKQYNGPDEYISVEAEAVKGCIQGSSNWTAAAAACAERSNIVGWSMYEWFLESILATFPRDNILFRYSENLATRTKDEILEIERFLGVGSYVSDEINYVYNTGKKLGWNRSKPIESFLEEGQSSSSKGEDRPAAPDDEMCQAFSSTYSYVREMADRGVLPPVPEHWHCGARAS